MALEWKPDEGCDAGYFAQSRDLYLRTFELDGRWHWESFVGRAEDIGQGEADSLDAAKDAAAKCVHGWLSSVAAQL